MRNLYSVGKLYIASALLYCRGLVSAFQVKLDANDLNCVDVTLNPTRSLTTGPTGSSWSAKNNSNGMPLVLADIDECRMHPCDVEALCHNEPGSFKCACRQGYAGDGITCEGINQSINQKLKNTP